MKLYTVKLNAWTTPVYVQASNKTKAQELALAQFPACDCCGAATAVEGVTIHQGSTPLYTSVIVEVTKK
jgi:hypothetical protein